MHQDTLAPGRPFPRLAAQIDRRFHVDEGEGHELGKSAGIFLQVPHRIEVPRPGRRSLDAAEHDRRRRLEPEPMGGADHRQPFAHANLVGAKNFPDRRIEDFRGGPGKGAEPCIDQPFEERVDGKAERRRALADLERREGVNVHVGRRRLHRAGYRDVGLAGVIGMDAALETDLGRAPIPGLAHAPRNLFEVEVVGRSAQPCARPSLGESAEPAGVRADVGVVDVAVDDIGDGISGDLAPHRVRRFHDRIEPAAARGEKVGDLAVVQAPPRGRLVEHGNQIVDSDRRRRDTRFRRRILRHSRPPALLPREAFRIDRPSHRRRERPIEPAIGFEGVSRVDREAFHENLARGGAAPGERFDLRPGRLGIDVVGRDRRDPAPVVEARRDQIGVCLGAQIGRCLDAHRRAEHDTRGGDGPGEVFRGRLRRVGHPRSWLRPEILDDDFLDMPVLALDIGDREQRIEAFEPRLSDTDKDARGEGNGELARLSDRREPRFGPLVGRTEMRPATTGEAGRQAFQHDALRDRNLAKRRDVVPAQHARIDVRQQPGLLEHETSGVEQVFDGRLESEPVERLAGGAIAQLRLVAEGEQRLLAAGRPSGLGDRQHLIRREIGGAVPTRRRGEGAVVAHVAAKPRQWNEHFPRVGNRVSESGVTQPARFRRELVERRREQIGTEFFGVHRAPTRVV